MGLLDHRRTWRYDVNASQTECTQAFVRAFSGRGGIVAKAQWEVRTTGQGALAIYLGRKGLGAAAGMVSGTAAGEQDSAVGSEVTFQIEKAEPARTRCAMRLTSSGRAGLPGLLGITSDARFIRPYMQAVRRELLALDPALRVSDGRGDGRSDAGEAGYRATTADEIRATPARIAHLEKLVARGVLTREDAAGMLTREGASVRVADEHWERISALW
jgi:hypothetical protein